MDIKRLLHCAQKIIAIVCVIAIAAFLLYYSINVLTNHRIHYSLEQATNILSESHYESLGMTPDKKQTLHLLVSSWLGTEYTVEATTRFSLRRKKVLFFAEERFKAPPGHLKENQSAFICSKDSRYLALSTSGWYVDCYDFQENKRIFSSNFLMGDFSKKENAEKLKQLQSDHLKIANLMGNDTVSVIQSE